MDPVLKEILIVVGPRAISVILKTWGVYDYCKRTGTPVGQLIGTINSSEEATATLAAISADIMFITQKVLETIEGANRRSVQNVSDSEQQSGDPHAAGGRGGPVGGLGGGGVHRPDGEPQVGGSLGADEEER